MEHPGRARVGTLHSSACTAAVRQVHAFAPTRTAAPGCDAPMTLRAGCLVTHQCLLDPCERWLVPTQVCAAAGAGAPCGASALRVGAEAEPRSGAPVIDARKRNNCIFADLTVHLAANPGSVGSRVWAAGQAGTISSHGSASTCGSQSSHKTQSFCQTQLESSP